MNKSVKRVSCIAMSLLLTAPFIAGCKKDKGADMETRAMVLSIDALDGKFNPYFATSAPDVSVTAQTQISMLSADSEGYPTCGQDEPTVALDYKVTEMNGDHVATAGEEVTSTEYEFVIKNGIKFSDGKPLTVKDVLFNLYVYLDPAYMGSSTIYSTKIQGLNAYRAQDPTLSNDSDLDTENTFETQARARLNNLVEYLAPPKGENPERTEQIEKDIKQAGFDTYFVDHTTGVYPTAASGFPWSAASMQVKGDLIADLTEDLAAEQKARVTYDNILRLSDDPDVNDVIKFLRQREIVHFQRFGEGLRLAQEKMDQKNLYFINPSFDKPS